MVFIRMFRSNAGAEPSIHAVTPGNLGIKRLQFIAPMGFPVAAASKRAMQSMLPRIVQHRINAFRRIRRPASRESRTLHVFQIHS
jgi:hypothetical protein